MKGMAMRGGFLAGIKKKKSFLLWLAPIAFILVSIPVLSSLGQILSLKNTAGLETKSSSLISENPVFIPLVRASRHFQELNSGSRVIYDGNSIADRSFSWEDQSKPEWWIPEVEGAESESAQLSESHNSISSEKLLSQNPLPRLRSGDLDAQARALEFISMGVTDLLNSLREKNLNRSSDGSTNPFEQALKATSSNAAVDKTKTAATPDAPKQEQQPAQNTSTASAGGGTPAKTNGKFLFIGNFDGQQVGTVLATSQDLFYQSNASAAVFDLAGLGNQSFDLNIILRNIDNQESISYGDLNGDGFPDLVVTNMVTNRAYVFLNDGQGNFTISSEIYGGLGPAAAAIGDFNGDGSPDVAVIIQTGKSIVVDGKGLRKFIFLPTSPIDKVYSSIIPYDFNGDGLNDLLLTNFGDSTTSVYLNQGDGTFVESTSLPLQSFPYLQYKADLNGDGIEDLVYVQHVGNQISIVVVNGMDGRISALANTAVDPSVYYVLGDFNQDGVIDIAIARHR